MYDCSKIKYLHAYEKEALFAVIDNDDSRYCVRNKAIFYLAEYAALRASEVGLIKLTDIDPYTNEIYFKRLKNSNNNKLRLIDTKVLAALQDYIDYRRSYGINSDFLFPSQKGDSISRKTLHDLTKKYSRLAGLPEDKSHFHVLKHTRAVELADLGLDTKEVQFWTGHKNIANTEIYLQFTTTQQNTLYRKITQLTLNPPQPLDSGTQFRLTL